MRNHRLNAGLLFLAAAFPPSHALAQAQPDLRQVIDRLDRLETQNQELLTEIRSLRQQLASSPPVSPPSPVAEAALPALTEERVEVQERRIEDLDQSKVGSEHRLPVRLTGTVLFNAFMNGKGSGGNQYPLIASPGRQASAGATMRQTILGLKFDGPEIAGGGKIQGSIYMDFFSGNTGLSQTMRLRLANIEAAWKYTTVSFAFDKPIISPREPDSLAQVGLSPLTAAGNLWLWQPQARVEQRVSLGSQSGLRAQFGLYQTSESGTGVSSDTLAPARPGYEGRFELWRQIGDSARVEIAPGFHESSTRVLGQSVPSRIFSLDWLIRPVARVDVTGAFYSGQNVGVLGALRQSVTIRNGVPIPVESMGGWAQVKVRLTPRLSFNGFGGQQDDRNRDLNTGGIAKNQSFGANLMYRVGSNVLTGLEASQVRTTYLGSGTRINQHYDLAIAYLF